MVLCCTEKLCGGTDTAPQGAHPLYRLSTASKQKIYQSEKRKVIGQTTLTTNWLRVFRSGEASRVGQGGKQQQHTWSGAVRKMGRLCGRSWDGNARHRSVL